MGDHECIHCGECISVCPTKAISWKGSKLFIKANETDAPTAIDGKPLTALLQKQAPMSAMKPESEDISANTEQKTEGRDA